VQTQSLTDDQGAILNRNQAWIKPGFHNFNTPLSPVEESLFRNWVNTNKVPFDLQALSSDYDMRGFWRALMAGDPRATTGINPDDKKLHYPDYWKTPLHESFSAESQWANDRAPRWINEHQLALPDGTVIFDERTKKPRR
jgi:hypothetical protein